MKANRARFFWRQAKKRLLDCGRTAVTRKKSQLPSTVTLDEPILEEVLKRLDLSERVQLRSLSPQLSNLVDRMPLTLPFVFLRSTTAAATSELTANPHDGSLSLVSRITGVSHLWLDSEWNGHLVQAIVEYYQSINVGNTRLSSAIYAFATVGCHSQPQTVQFWSAISQCPRLEGLQYEPCRLDKWSRPHLIDALDNKCLKSLILTGIDGLRPSRSHSDCVWLPARGTGGCG
ncbi:F-box domain protein [Ostertagia ostertagi]